MCLTILVLFALKKTVAAIGNAFSANPVVAPNCGGVIERTVPRPPMVPPAIKKKRLISIVISLIQPSEIQILRYENDPLEYQRHEQLYELSLPNQLVHRYIHRIR